MAAVVLGRQWNLAPVTYKSTSSSNNSNVPLVVGVSQAKSISVKSMSAVGGTTTTTATSAAAAAATTAALAVSSSSATAAGATAAAAAAVVVVASSSSQQSSAKIKRSNRRSRFGEPLSTTDCDDDDDLCDALSADFHLLEVGLLEEELAGRKGHRRQKRIARAGAKRLDSSRMANSKVLTDVQQQKEGRNPEIIKQQQVRSSAARIEPGPAGIKFKSPRARPPSVDDTYSVSEIGDKLLTRKSWEEQAYQIIRRQKLRDAALAETKAGMPAQQSKELGRTPRSETMVTSVTTNGSPQRGTPLTVDAGGKEDGEVSSMSKRLGLEDKCEALVVYLHSLGVREREFIRIVDKHKACLQANVNVVRERVDYLLSVGVQPQHIPKLVVRHPQIVEYRVEQAVKPRVKYLKSIGLDESKIGKIITVSPSLLECSLERSIKPRLAYLVKNVGVKSEDMGKIVMRSPQILTQSIEDSLEPRLDFYLNELKLSKEALAKMVTRHPQLLHYSIEDGVRPRVKYLRSLGMSDDDVIKVLTRLTQILSLSVDNCLQPKYNYLVNELKGGVHTVTSFPAYFSLSLDQRIIPRHRYSELLERTPEGPFPMRLLTVSDIGFCQWAKSSVEAYDKFRHDLLLSTFAKNFELKNKVHI